MIIRALLLFLLISSNVNGAESILDSISSLWNSLGGQSVSTGSNIYASQQSGNVTLGSIYIANKKHNRNLINVTFPTIDINHPCVKNSVLNFGGISFISGDELKEKLQSIAQTAGMIFVYLGLSSISPVISETLQEVYSKLQEVGGFLSDECLAAEMAVNFIKDKYTQYNTLRKKQVTDYELSKGDKTDIAGAYRSYPKDSGALSKEIGEKHPEKRLVNINLAWESLKKLQDVDIETKRLMMSISGTIIILENENDPDGHPAVEHIMPKITDPTVFQGLLKGSEQMSLLTCKDSDKCLHVKDEGFKLLSLQQRRGFEETVSDHFANFKIALDEDEELKPSSQSFLSQAGIPVYMMYDVLYRKTNGKPDAEAGILIQITSWNILYHYLTELINDSIKASNNYTILAADELNTYRKNLILAREMLGKYKMQDHNMHNLHVLLAQRSESQQRYLNNVGLKRVGANGF